MLNTINYPDGTSVNVDWKNKIGKYHNFLHLGTDEFKAVYVESKEYQANFYIDYNSSWSWLKYVMVLSFNGQVENAIVLDQIEVFKLIKSGNIKNIEIKAD